ncbi:MAG: hypothetical protein ACE5HR_00140 [bacterium]
MELFHFYNAQAFLIRRGYSRLNEDWIKDDVEGTFKEIDEKYPYMLEDLSRVLIQCNELIAIHGDWAKYIKPPQAPLPSQDISSLFYDINESIREEEKRTIANINDLLMRKDGKRGFGEYGTYWRYDEDTLGSFIMALLYCYDIKNFFIRQKYNRINKSCQKGRLDAIFKDIGENYPFVFDKMREIEKEYPLRLKEVEYMYDDLFKEEQLVHI